MYFSESITCVGSPHDCALSPRLVIQCVNSCRSRHEGHRLVRLFDNTALLFLASGPVDNHTFALEDYIAWCDDNF